MFIKPADNRNVRDPLTRRHIPADGAHVPDTTYWRRRIEAGDVLIVNPDPETAAAEPQGASQAQKTQPARSAKRGSKE